MDPAIELFFSERREAWLKKNIKSTMGEEEVLTKQSVCKEIFSREVWLPKAAKRAGQMSMSTHPCTFSHPSSRKNKNGYSTPVLADVLFSSDGFLRTGNINVEIDALGNAAALDVYKFLTLKMVDARSLIEHIQKDTKLAVDLLSVNTEDYDTLKQGFLAMLQSPENNIPITSSKIKQVYFPVNPGYHLLSILSNSGIIYELRSRIDEIRFSEQNKQSRELKKRYSYCERGFSELYGLTTIGYGGTKPQNISVMNNQRGGKAHLLSSMPPVLQKRTIRFPKSNFFKESLRDYEYRDIYHALHNLLKTDYNNHKIREGRDYRIQSLIDLVIEKMWAVRPVCEEQYQADQSSLKPHQKIWLCSEAVQQREDEDGWLNILCKEITRWIIQTYERLAGKHAYKLGDTEARHIHQLVLESREFLR